MNIRHFVILLFLFFSCALFAQPSVNVYVWGGEIPKQVIQQFETTTGIHVNFSTYDSNETLYTKLKASSHGMYDVILPSSYYVERMAHQGMLMPINQQRLNHLHHIDAFFMNKPYDPHNQYSVPLIWGATGLFYNRDTVKQAPTSWKQLWSKEFSNMLLLLDDSREVFAMALLSRGYSPNDGNPEHIREAFTKLLALRPNIKLFSTEGIQALLIDEDVMAGMVWNGDAYKAHAENNAIQFTYPKDGFVIWTDCLAIPANAPHPQEAHQFINFLLRPDIAKQIGLAQGHAITNARGKALLPTPIQNNPLIYPPAEVLTHGYFQGYPGEKAVGLYNEYWQQLKLAL